MASKKHRHKNTMTNTVDPEKMLYILYSYNSSKRCERVNDHMNKLRDRLVKDDTSSSCTSALVVFPKPSKQKQAGREGVELRRSPRKKAPRSALDENIPLSQKSANIK